MTNNEFFKDLIAEPLARTPDKTALSMGGRSLSFKQLDERARKLASVLAGKDCHRGDRIALLANNELEFFELQIACCRLGLAFVPINWRLSSTEINALLEEARPTLVIHSLEFSDHLTDFLGQKLELGETYEVLLDKALPRETVIQTIDDEATFAILFTSGTTGSPKGAMLSNRSIRSRISVCVNEQNITSSDCFLMIMPLFHVGSITALSYLNAGAEIVIVQGFSPDQFTQVVSKHNVNVCMLVPTMIKAIVSDSTASKSDLNQIDLIIYGGSPIQAALLRQAQEVFKCDFLQNYGMTETGPITCLRPKDHVSREDGNNLLASAGSCVKGCEIRVVDDNQKSVAAGFLGEVICRGEVLMDRYLHNDLETRLALVDGWMHTGDIGYLDDENYLFITDRKKDLIISGGENISPREIEVVLEQHDQIAESAVIGVPDEYWGERVHGIVVLKPGVSLEISKIQDFCRSRLAAYKIPKSIEFIHELPRNLSGKIERKSLRTQWWQNEKRQVH